MLWLSNSKLSAFIQYTIPAFACTVQYELCHIALPLREYDVSYLPFKGTWEWGRAGPDRHGIPEVGCVEVFWGMGASVRRNTPLQTLGMRCSPSRAGLHLARASIERGEAFGQRWRIESGVETELHARDPNVPFYLLGVRAVKLKIYV